MIAAWTCPWCGCVPLGDLPIAPETIKAGIGGFEVKSSFDEGFVDIEWAPRAPGRFWYGFGTATALWAFFTIMLKIAGLPWISSP